MPLTSELVDTEVGRISVVCDARWLMAYAAGIPDERTDLFDTTTTLVPHPMFPVAPEWALLASHRASPSTMTRNELSRGVHAAHDIIHERSIVPGETIDITARVVAVGRRRAGATQTTLFEASDADGRRVWRTKFLALFRGVELDGDPVSADLNWPPLSRQPAQPNGSENSPEPIAVRTSHVRSIDAHIYTECARIWNPIHTDLASARAAGLDAPILHGTATLARAVSIVTELTSTRLADIGRVSAAFTSMIPLPSSMTIRVLATDDHSTHFDVVDESGHRAIKNGTVERFRDSAAR